MQFLLLCRFDETRWGSLSDAQRGQIMRDYGEVLQGLDRSGRHLASARLQPSSAGATVRASNGMLSVTDGPYAETKEQLGGYHLVECASRDEAIAIAKRIPTIPFGGAVEVRALDTQENA
jgi:hypothetical protein